MKFFNKVFHFQERGATFKGEIIGALVTFASIIYILPINASLLSATGMNSGGVFFTTALVSFICCLLMGLIANYPLALSAGMGMNAYLSYTICDIMGFSWIEAMMLLTVNGILFMILTLTPLRMIIVNAIPKGLRSAISVGLGGFILFVGLQGSGIISDGSTLVTLGDFSNPSVLLASFGILLCLGFMAFKKVPILSQLAIPIALVVTAIVGVIASLSLTVAGQGDFASVSGLPLAPWADPSVFWGVSGLDKVIFYGALDPANANVNYGEMIVNLLANPQTYVAIFTLIFVNMFDTTATMLTCGKHCGLVNKEGQLIGAKRAMLADSTGAVLAGPFGTSTVTSFAESAIGISLGAKTGFSSVIIAVLFLISGFAFPIFSVFSYSSVNAVALVGVGLLIMSSAVPDMVKEDATTLISGILLFLMMILTYSLSNGLAIGIIAYIVMRLFEGKWKEISIPVYVLGLIFLASFIITSL